MNIATTTLADDTAEIAELHRIFALQKAAYKADPYPSLEARRDLLGKLAGMALSNREAIKAAMVADFGAAPSQFNDLAEVLSAPGRVAHAMEMLETWIAEDDRPGDPGFMGTARAYIRPEPKGVVGNISPWNFPFDISIGPLAEMFAAGNRVIIKPSEHAPTCAALVKKMVSETFPEEVCAVVTGGLQLSQAFTALRWDHLMYTGSPAVGREVAKAAAANLVPVTLELGGKCPVIFTDDAVTGPRVASMIGGKLIKNGQMCVTADYAFVPRAQVEAFVTETRAFFASHAEDYTTTQGCTGIITPRHYDRITTLLEEAKASGAEVVTLGGAANPETRQMPFSLVIDPSEDIAIMREEIFGPILPVIPYDTLDDAIARINAGEKPLGLYIYTEDDAVADQVIRSTSSGGVCVNGIGFQAALANMGFGGVGESGMGRHHGVEGFREFSNPRGILKRGDGDLIDAMNPPYGDLANAIVEGAYAGIPGPDEG